MSTSHRTSGRSLALAMVAAMLIAALPATPVLADSTAQSVPFAQNWSDTGLITTNDDWSGVPGIVGHLGQDITTTTGADPQTLLTESAVANDIDVIANQVSTGISNGGVAEFHLTDPVVALQGSGTADAPYLLLNLNTTGLATVSVAYSLRDLDSGIDNAAQQVALQFRVGSTGNFTNVPAGYVADATTGPSQATLVTPIAATLPASADNQPLVQVRVITSNTVGVDEWVGVDNISITAQAGDAQATVTSTDPVDGATGVSAEANLSVTFSEAVTVTDPWFTISCTASGSHAASVSGGSTTFTLDPTTSFAGNETCTLTVLAAQVSDADANDPPDTLAQDVSVDFTIASTDPCADPFTPIYSIQGSGTAAAITGDVTTQGVVVGDFDGPTNVGLQGFYLQDAAGDGNAATSDGIFVFTGNAAGLVDTGDVVRVSGVARERFNQTAITGANNNTTPTTVIVDCGSTDSVDPMDVTLPNESSTTLERYEGMLVRFPQPLVIAEYFNYDQFGEIVLALPLAGEDRPFTGTAIDEPGAPALARTLANSLRRITLDDTLAVSNPPTLRHPNGLPFSVANLFRGGDTVANAVGVLGFDFSQYRIQPTAVANYTQLNPRPVAPDPVGGTLRAAAMNTLNFFLTPDNIQEASNAPDDPADNLCGGLANLECRGWDANQATEFTRQRDKLLAALAGLDADIIGLNEIENTPGVEPLLDPEDGVVAGLNALPGVGPYAAIDTGVIGTDAIRVGLIYRSDTVVPIGPYKVLTSAIDPRFIDTRSRPVLAQTFEEIATGARITVAVNHLKSKGSGCGSGDDATDGSGNCNGTRTQAAEALVDWLAKDPTGSGDRDYLILGDLNSYAKEAPIDEILAGADDIVGTSDDFTNLIEKYQGAYAHSYVFDGQAGYLDHALASATLVAQVTGATDWHINSDESDVVDYDTSFKPAEQEALYQANPYRSSDHDPVVVGLDLLNFGFNGYLSPVDNPPVVNTVNAGRTIPMKFTLSADLGLDVLFGTPTATTFTCTSGAPTDEVETTTSSGASGLTYDAATGEYTYAWNTQKGWAGQCRTFTATFDDGAYRTANFQFR